jgi:hypothetical protein
MKIAPYTHPKIALKQKHCWSKFSTTRRPYGEITSKSKPLEPPNPFCAQDRRSSKGTQASSATSNHRQTLSKYRLRCGHLDHQRHSKIFKTISVLGTTKDHKIQERSPHLGTIRKLPQLHPNNRKKTTRKNKPFTSTEPTTPKKKKGNKYLYIDLTPKKLGRREAPYFINTLPQGFCSQRK